MGEVINSKKFTQGKSEHSTIYSSVVNVPIVIIMWYKYNGRWEKRKRKIDYGRRKGGKMLNHFLSQ